MKRNILFILVESVVVASALFFNGRGCNILVLLIVYLMPIVIIVQGMFFAENLKKYSTSSINRIFSLLAVLIVSFFLYSILYFVTIKVLSYSFPGLVAEYKHGCVI